MSGPDIMARFYPIRVPTHTHPVVREFFQLRNQERVPTRVIRQRAGLGRDTITGWTKDCMPNVANLDAALRVLGYRLAVVRDTETKAKKEDQT